MDRRGFTAFLGGTLAAGFALPARAQRPAALPVVGLLTPHPPLPPDQAARSPIIAMQKRLGWVQGETFEIQRPSADGREGRLPAMAEELARKRVDVIWAIGPEAG
jgi:hypothetical protein